MAQITLTGSGGDTLTLELIRGTLQQQDSASDNAETFFPRTRLGLGQTGSCAVFLPMENLAETMVKLLTFAASPGEGKLRIGGDSVTPVCKALVNVTFLPDPPRAELVWQGMKEG